MEDPVSALEVLQLLKNAAGKVRDPLTGQSLLQAGMIGSSRLENGRLVFQLLVSPRHDEEQRRRMLSSLGRHVKHAGWNGPLDAELAEVPSFDAEQAPPPSGAHHGHGPAPASGAQPQGKTPIPGVKHVVAVASGKGGVGKSTVAVQLARGLRDLGHAVGIMDADIYGPSLPMMLGIQQRPSLDEHGKIVPISAHGMRCMSVGFLVGERIPLIWRGPMVVGVVRQFIQDVDWSGLDYLVIDLPPGTGDAQLSMAQLVPVSGAVVVSTPQQLALLDAVRGLEMFDKLEIPILGIVENMAWYPLPGGGRDHPFGQGGARALAEQRGVDLLAELPLHSSLRIAGDTGEPSLAADSAVGPALEALARRVFDKLPVGDPS